MVMLTDTSVNANSAKASVAGMEVMPPPVAEEEFAEVMPPPMALSSQGDLATVVGENWEPGSQGDVGPPPLEGEKMSANGAAYQGFDMMPPPVSRKASTKAAPASELFDEVDVDADTETEDYASASVEGARDVVYSDKNETMPEVPPTGAPTPEPTEHPTESPTPYPSPAPTLEPTAKPTEPPAPPPTVPPTEPATCANCIALFVQNHGCTLWKGGEDPKPAIPESCRAEDSPLLNDFDCEAKLVSVCGMKKREMDLSPPPPPLRTCNAEELAELKSREGGHLGCVSSGGECVVNVGIPQCQCHAGYSGRACDIGPAGDRNVSVSATLLAGFDLIQQSQGACPAGHSVKGLESSQLTDDLSLALGQTALEGHEMVFAVLEAPENVDWIKDFQFVHADIAGHQHRVHLGFWNKIGTLLPSIGEKIKSKIGSHEHLVVLGYGQAGSLANILAMYLQHTLSTKKVTLVTYGAPRVGDYHFATKLTETLDEIVRVNRQGDPYTVVPTTSCRDYFRCLGGEMPYVYYVHAGPQTTIPGTGPSLCSHPTFHDEGIDGGLGHLEKLKKGPHGDECFGIHEPAKYATSIAAQVPKGYFHICTEPTFVYLPPPPPPPPTVIKKLYTQKPPSLKNWGDDPDSSRNIHS